MQAPIIPTSAQVDLENGTLEAAAGTIVRRLSDMADHYQDQEAARALLAEDPLVYRVYMAWEREEGYRWLAGTTVIEPGRVGEEYFMTKGHFHAARYAPEIYFTLRGEGLLLMQTRGGEPQELPLQPGAIQYIPGGWAHRAVNTGEAALIFFAVWPREAGHDYAGVAERGFPRLVVLRDGRPAVVANPDFRGGRG
jgi:glucose-6-phosphate isomerase